MSLTILTILLMAITTWLTRITGYLVLRDKKLSTRMRAVIETAPGCILVTVISPHFVTTSITEMLAVLISMLAVTRFSLLPVVLISIIATAILRYLSS